MPTLMDKITPRMVSASNIEREWVYWFQKIANLQGSKLDTVLGHDGEIAIFNAEGEVTGTGVSLPDGDIVGTTDTQTLSNKTLVEPTIASFVNAQHDHTSAIEGGALAGYQPVDATLTALAGLTTAANQLILATGVNTFSMISCTAAGQELINDATAAAQATTLGLGTGNTPTFTGLILSGGITSQDDDAGYSALRGGSASGRGAQIALYGRDHADANLKGNAYFGCAGTTALLATSKFVWRAYNDAGATETWADLATDGFNLASGKTYQINNVALAATDVGAAATIHNLVDTTNHPVTGLTTGHFLKSTGATTYAFGAHDLSASDVGAQAVDATLTALAGLTISANNLLLCTGPDAFSVGQLTDAYVALANKDGASSTACLRTLGSGSAQAAAGNHTHTAGDVGAQPVDATLTAFSGLTIAANQLIVGTGADAFSMLTLTEQTVAGRVTGGAVAAIAIDSDLSSVSAADDTIPSAKAVKAYADLMLPLTAGSGKALTGTLYLTPSSGYSLSSRLGNLDLGQDTTLNLNMRSHHDTAANGPYISYYRSRGNEAAKTAVANNTVLGSIRSYAYETTSEPDTYAQVASIKFEATETHTDITKGTRFTISTTPEGAASEVDRIRVTGTGLTRIGEATGSDYIQFSTNGFCSLAGTCKSKLSMRPFIEQGSIAGAGKPTIVTRGSSKGYSLPLYAADEELFISELIAGRWDGASDITVSVVGYLDTAEDVGDDFALQISWANKATSSGTWGSSLTDVEVRTNIDTGRSAQFSIYKVDFTIDWNLLTPTVVASDFFAARLRRIAVGGGYTEMSGEFVVTAIWISYTVDKMFKAA